MVLRKQIEVLGQKVEWEDLIRDLSQVREIGLQPEERRYLLRTDLVGVAQWASRPSACGRHRWRRSSGGPRRRPERSGKVTPDTHKCLLINKIENRPVEDGLKRRHSFPA